MAIDQRGENKNTHTVQTMTDGIRSFGLLHAPVLTSPLCVQMPWQGARLSGRRITARRPRYAGEKIFVLEARTKQNSFRLALWKEEN